MTFYHVDIYSANLAGSASDMTTLLAAMNSVERHFDAGLVVNGGWCEECKRQPYKAGDDPNYHSFMARELPILEIIEAGDFNWTKKKGMGRATPSASLQEAVSQGTELWFQLELSEI